MTADPTGRKPWTLADAPRLDGRLALVTGATSGLGYETALGLARLGAGVILSGRDAGRGRAALDRLARAVPDASMRFEPLDLGSLASVEGCAARLLAEEGRLDILVCNAGVMAMPRRETTADGFERQFGTNHLGHFALVARLLPLLLRARPEARVVSVASLAHKKGRIAFDDLDGERNYDPWGAYRQSKLATLMFARTLQRRAEEHGWPLRSVAAHPGWSVTNIVNAGPGPGQPRWKTALMNFFFGLVAQSAAEGALPILFAAADPGAEPSGYYGPTRRGETVGPVGAATVAPQAADTRAAERLWRVSEEATGLTLPVADQHVSS